MARAALGLGANLEDPARQIELAIAMLAEHPHVTLVARSSMLITPPWGKTDQPEFHNAAILIETDLPPLDLLELCLTTEAQIGRVRRERWGPRIIDIDVIAYDRLVLDSARLTLPHPLAHERAFVLDPLREIAPEIADWLVNRKLNAPA